MRLENHGQPNTFGGDKFTVESSASIFHIMSTSLYTRPELAACRELLSNAIDATREASSEKCSMDVTTKGITVVDYGHGMSKEVIKKVYSSLFSTTKNSDDSSTGGFGVGALSAFAVADWFTVSTRTKSETHGRKYDVSKGEDGIPTITLLDDGIEMPIGTKVEVEMDEFSLPTEDVKTLLLIGYVNRDACGVICYHRTLTKASGDTTGLHGLLFDARVGYLWPLWGNTFILSETVSGIVDTLMECLRYNKVSHGGFRSPSTRNSFVSQGSNIYPIGGLVNDCPRGLYIEAPIGTFEMSPARETLLNTPKNMGRSVSLLQDALYKLRAGYGNLAKQPSGMGSRAAEWLIGDITRPLPYHLRRGSEIVKDTIGRTATVKYDRRSACETRVAVAFVPSSISYQNVKFSDYRPSQVIVKAPKKLLTPERKEAFLIRLHEELNKSFSEATIYEADWENSTPTTYGRADREYTYMNGRYSRTHKKRDVYFMKGGSNYHVERFVDTVGPKNFPCNGFDRFNPIYRTSQWVDKNDPDHKFMAENYVVSAINSDPKLRELAVDKVSAAYVVDMKRFISYGSDSGMRQVHNIKGIEDLVEEALDDAIERLAQELQVKDVAEAIFRDLVPTSRYMEKGFCLKLASMIDMDAFKATYKASKGTE